MNVQKIIKRQGFTIASVAAKMKNERMDKTGMSQGSLSSMLNNNPSINRLQEIADIIGVSLAELVSDETDHRAYIVCPHCGERIKICVDK